MFPILLVVYVRLAKREEQITLEELGDKYRQYMEKTPAWVSKFKKELVTTNGGKTMKTLATAIALTVALSTPVFASSDDDHEHNSDMKGTEMHGDMMMGHEYLMEMNEHMQETQKLMARIKQEDDPKKRDKFLRFLHMLIHFHQT